MNKILSALIFLLLASSSVFSNTITLNKPRGQYQLDFDAIYCIGLSFDVWTLIKFPEGFEITSTPSGSPDLVTAHQLQNRVYLTKTAPENNFVCNVVIHVKTPEGLDKEIMFQCSPVKSKTDIVFGVTFIEPDYSACSEVANAIRTKFKKDMDNNNLLQKLTLDSTIYTSTLIESQPIFMGIHRGELKKEYKGAEVWFDGIIKSRGFFYVYMHANVNMLDSNILKFHGIKTGDNLSGGDFVKIESTAERTYRYVFRCPAVSDSKKHDIKFVVEIWSKIFEVSATIS